MPERPEVMDAWFAPRTPAWIGPIPNWLLRLADRSLQAVALGLGSARAIARYRLQVERFYRTRSDDVFVCSFPKSGNTLLRMLLYQITTDGELRFSHFDEVSPWWDFALFDNPALLATTPSPRVFKSHFRFAQLPRDAKKIYVVRPLADVAVSAFHHGRIVGGRPEGFEQHIDGFIDGSSVEWGSWYRHVGSWWPHRASRNLLMLRYDEVTRDVGATALRVARFCGFDLDPKCLPRIVERCSLAFMKQHTARFNPRPFDRPSGPSDASEPRRGGDFINKGQSGAGLSQLSEPQRRRMATRLAALARQLGVRDDDPWADLFRLPGYSVA